VSRRRHDVNDKVGDGVGDVAIVITTAAAIATAVVVVVVVVVVAEQARANQF
jgi:hypothetical protein